jgi:hypothetical protein
VQARNQGITLAVKEAARANYKSCKRGLFMNQKLDLNDLKIDTFDVDTLNDSLNEYIEGHGLTEIGASTQSGNNSCGIGSCKSQS